MVKEWLGGYSEQARDHKNALMHQSLIIIENCSQNDNEDQQLHDGDVVDDDDEEEQAVE